MCLFFKVEFSSFFFEKKTKPKPTSGHQTGKKWQWGTICIFLKYFFFAETYTISLDVYIDLSLTVSPP